ncbi:MAG: hypothetical protein ABIT76_08095 [Chthoniobacterales bacterium]
MSKQSVSQFNRNRSKHRLGVKISHFITQKFGLQRLMSDRTKRMFHFETAMRRSEGGRIDSGLRMFAFTAQMSPMQSRMFDLTCCMFG